GRGTDLRQFGAHIDEDTDIELRAADTSRLDDAEQARIMQVALGLVGQPPQPLAHLGALGQHRLERSRSRQHVLVTDSSEGRSLLGQYGRWRPRNRPCIGHDYFLPGKSASWKGDSIAMALHRHHVSNEQERRESMYEPLVIEVWGKP